MRHFLAQRPGGDLHVAIGADQGVDLVRMGAGDIHHDRNFDAAAVVQDHALHAVPLCGDPDHAPIEEEFGAHPLSRVLDVLCRQLRIRDVAALGEIDGALDRATRRFPEVRIPETLGRRKRGQVVEGKTLENSVAGAAVDLIAFKA